MDYNDFAQGPQPGSPKDDTEYNSSKPVFTPIGENSNPADSFSSNRPRFEAVGPGKFQRERASNAYANYLSQPGVDIESETARVNSAEYLSKTLNIPYTRAYNDLDIITEEITGVSSDPKRFWENVSDGIHDGMLDTKNMELHAELLRNPTEARKQAIYDMIDTNNSNYSAQDPFEHGKFHDMSGGTARILP